MTNEIPTYDCFSVESIELCQQILAEPFIEEQISQFDDKKQVTSDHIKRGASIVTAFALEMAPDNKESIIRCYTLHDIGKLAILAEVLNKPGGLTAEEWVEVKKHPEIGYFRSICELGARAAIPILRHHTVRGRRRGVAGEPYPTEVEQSIILESVDVSPKDLVAEDIMASTTLIIVADQIEALTSHNREYIDKQYNITEALDQVRASFKESAIFAAYGQKELLEKLLEFSQETILKT